MSAWYAKGGLRPKTYRFVVADHTRTGCNNIRHIHNDECIVDPSGNCTRVDDRHRKYCPKETQ